MYAMYINVCECFQCIKLESYRVIKMTVLMVHPAGPGIAKFMLYHESTSEDFMINVKCKDN